MWAPSGTTASRRVIDAQGRHSASTSGSAGAGNAHIIALRMDMVVGGCVAILAAPRCMFRVCVCVGRGYRISSLHYIREVGCGRSVHRIRTGNAPGGCARRLAILTFRSTGGMLALNGVLRRLLYVVVDWPRVGFVASHTAPPTAGAHTEGTGPSGRLRGLTTRRLPSSGGRRSASLRRSAPRAVLCELSVSKAASHVWLALVPFATRRGGVAATLAAALCVAASGTATGWLRAVVATATVRRGVSWSRAFSPGKPMAALW